MGSALMSNFFILYCCKKVFYWGLKCHNPIQLMFFKSFCAGI